MKVLTFKLKLNIKRAALLSLMALGSGCPLPSAYTSPVYSSGYGSGQVYTPPDTTQSRISSGPYSGLNGSSLNIKGFPLMFEAAWSPDGQQLAILAFANTYGEYVPQVYLTDVASGKVTSSWTIRNPAELLTQGTGEDAPPRLSWSSRGDSLMVLQQSGRKQAIERVYLHQLRAGAPVESRVIDLPLRFNQPGFRGFSQVSLAPDHRSLALIERQAGTRQSEQLQPQRLDLASDSLSPIGPALPASGFLVERPLWYQDQSRLLLLYSPVATDSQSDPGRTRIVSVALNDGQHEIHYESEHIQLRQARLSPDGQKLIAGLAQFTATPDSLGAASRQIFPFDSQPDQGLALTQLSLDSRRSDWFSQQLNLSGSVFWHGNEQFLAGQTSQTSDDSWILWDLPSQSIKARYSRPELSGLKPGQTLALAPYPKLQLAVSLYNPCCTLKNLRTGVHLWDLERRRFTRVGPDIATLVKDFPQLAIHDQTIYGSSAERTNYTSGSARTP